MTNPSQHSNESTLNVSLPHVVNIRLIGALDMLWIGGVVFSFTGHAVREFRDPSCHEMVDVI